MTGYGATASMLGLPDAGLATYSDMVGPRRDDLLGGRDAADRRCRHRLWRAAERAAHGPRPRGRGRGGDPDRGSGDAPRSAAIRPAGASCRPRTWRSRSRVAAEARRHEETLIVARTDARTAHGARRGAAPRPALRRGRRRRDLRRIARVRARELERIGTEVSKPLLANAMVEFGKTPRVEADRLKKWGFDLAIYPGAGLQRRRRGDAA